MILIHHGYVVYTAQTERTEPTMPNLRANLIRLAQIHPESRSQLLRVLLASKMPEPQFWALVDGLGWGTKTTDYRALKKKLVRNLSPNDAEGFRTTFGQMTANLSRVLTRWEEDGYEWGQSSNPRSFGLGDDSWSDLLAHIVGLGKREYKAILANPQKALDRARKGDFKESFAYALPYTDDYALLDVSQYIQRAAPFLELIVWLISQPETKDIRRALDTLHEGLVLMKQEKVHDLMDRRAEMVAAANAFKAWWQGLHLRGDQNTLLKRIPRDMSDPSHLSYAVDNILTDMQDYLLG